MGKKHVLDKKILEGLQFALYEVFFEIKTGSWIPFSESDVFASLLQRKEGNLQDYNTPANTTPSTL